MWNFELWIQFKFFSHIPSQLSQHYLLNTYFFSNLKYILKIHNKFTGLLLYSLNCFSHLPISSSVSRFYFLFLKFIFIYYYCFLILTCGQDRETSISSPPRSTLTGDRPHIQGMCPHQESNPQSLWPTGRYSKRLNTTSQHSTSVLIARYITSDIS